LHVVLILGAPCQAKSKMAEACFCSAGPGFCGLRYRCGFLRRISWRLSVVRLKRAKPFKSLAQIPIHVYVHTMDKFKLNLAPV